MQLINSYVQHMYLYTLPFDNSYIRYTKSNILVLKLFIWDTKLYTRDTKSYTQYTKLFVRDTSHMYKILVICTRY